MVTGYETPSEASYHKLERLQFDGLARRTWWIMTFLAAVAVVFNPIEALIDRMFGGSDDNDGEETPDYSMAERFPEDEK